MISSNDTYLSRLREIHLALNCPETLLQERNLPLFYEADDLVEVVGEYSDKVYRLTRNTAMAWREMTDAAKIDNIPLILVSGFRSIEHQRALIEKRLARGQNITEILSLLAPPGYSEHHTGTAVDLTTIDCDACVEHFEATVAFTWLQSNAMRFGFTLSYPRDNPFGFVYEPWHWAYRG